MAQNWDNKVRRINTPPFFFPHCSHRPGKLSEIIIKGLLWGGCRELSDRQVREMEGNSRGLDLLQMVCLKGSVFINREGGIWS